jgi:PhnB protein
MRCLFFVGDVDLAGGSGVTPAMTKTTHHVPPGLSALVPQLVVADGHALLDFLGRALGAETFGVMPGPDGKGVMHAAVRVGEGWVFVSDASEFAKPTQGNLFLYVPDVDAVFARAVAAGATALVPVATMFWGDRWGMIADPFGNVWQLATHVEDVPPEQMGERMKAAAGSR